MNQQSTAWLATPRGILLAAVVTSWLRLPMSLEVIVEYVARFAVGLFVFQALCMKPSFDGSYWRAVKGTLLAETLSMNAMMAGMIPVMVKRALFKCFDVMKHALIEREQTASAKTKLRRRDENQCH